MVLGYRLFIRGARNGDWIHMASYPDKTPCGARESFRVNFGAFMRLREWRIEAVYS